MKSPSYSNYYVYVYIDPRSLKEFYYGKGRGDRKLAHLHDTSDSEKSKIIHEIQEQGLKPIIRVVARDLTEQQALLVEKTLIWRLGSNLTNIASGHFSENFRPHNTLHREIFGFDYENGIYYVNVGEGEHRNWDDCRAYGFLSAGQDWEAWGRKLYVLKPGDVIVAYLRGHGYVGVGRVTEPAQPAVDFRFQGRPLDPKLLRQPALLQITEDPKDAEHLLRIEWLATVGREDGKWNKKEGLFTSQLVVASLESQPKTLEYVGESFGLDLSDLLSRTPAEKKAA